MYISKQYNHINLQHEPLRRETKENQRNKYCHMFRVRVTYKKGSGLDDWIYCTLYIHNSGLQAITALSLTYTLQFTVAHAIRFSVFTTRVLAIDL
jgi:hypothetical protein